MLQLPLPSATTVPSDTPSWNPTVTVLLASAVPTTVASPVWPLTVLSDPPIAPPAPMLLITGFVVVVSTVKLPEVVALEVLPAVSVAVAVTVLPLPWPIVVRFPAVSV